MTRRSEIKRIVGEDAQAAAGAAEQRFAFQLGRAVRLLRQQQGMSQAALAEAMQTTQSEVSQIETGGLPRGPSEVTLIKIARALGQELSIKFRPDGAVDVSFLPLQILQTDPVSVSVEIIPMYEKSGR